jgi:arsenate reductase-like glutaredoxin family protein
MVTCRSGLDCPNIATCEKLKSKLKMMEISFEQINNSRNDLIKQLGEQELLSEKLNQFVTRFNEQLEFFNTIVRGQEKVPSWQGYSTESIIAYTLQEIKDGKK